MSTLQVSLSKFVVLTALVAFGLIPCAVAQPSSYPGASDFSVRDLDPTLTQDVNAVVRINETVFEVNGPGRAREKVRRAVTILNADGRSAGSLTVWYDGFRRIRSLDASIIDREGRRIRKIRNNEMQDVSMISGYSLYTESRQRIVDVRHDSYPYTVVFEYEIDHRGLLNWPAWYPLDDEASVEWARLSVSAPPDISVRYNIRGEISEPTVKRASKVEYEWTAANILYTRPEPLGPPLWVQYPSVVTAPDQFEIGGHPGRLDSWSAFGHWYHGLARGRDVLDERTRGIVQAIRAEEEDDFEVARRLYRHLQESTRYVNVSLGIGGWQPYDAAYVIERGYGDCKALTNYLYALLKEAGVAAYPALIRSEVYPYRIDEDFPSNQFNHVILMVPFTERGDTLWLEATSQTIPFGHIGARNEARWALVVKDSGGELVRTPASKPEANLQHRVGKVTIEADGRAAVHLETRFAGNQQDRMRPLASASPVVRERFIHSALGLNDYRVVASDFNGLATRSTEIALPVELFVPRFASRVGSRIFFEPNVAERWKSVPPEVGSRSMEVVVASYPYLDHDHIEFSLPSGFRIEGLPSDVLLEAPFGTYNATYSVDEEGRLMYERRLEIRDTILPAEQYDAYRSFTESVVRSDAARVVLTSDE